MSTFTIKSPEQIAEEKARGMRREPGAPDDSFQMYDYCRTMSPEQRACMAALKELEWAAEKQRREFVAQGRGDLAHSAWLTLCDIQHLMSNV